MTGGAYAFIVLEQCFAARPLVEVGRWRRLSYLGARTYGLYLLHPIAIQAVLVANRLAGVDAPGPGLLVARGTVAFALSVALALASYRWLEAPFLRLKNRFAHVPTFTGIDTSSAPRSSRSAS